MGTYAPNQQMRLLGKLSCILCSRVQNSEAVFGGETLGLCEAYDTTARKFRFILAMQSRNLQEKSNFFHFSAPMPFSSPSPPKKAHLQKSNSNKSRYIKAFSSILGFQENVFIFFSFLRAAQVNV